MNVECESVVMVLREEQRALTRMAYALEVQRLVLDSGRSDLSAQAGKDVEEALARLRRADLSRAVTVAAVHLDLVEELGAMGLAPGPFPTLGQIAAAAPGGDAGVLLGIGEELERLLARVMALADENMTRFERMHRMLRGVAGESVEVRLERFLSGLAVPDTPDELLDALEEAVVGSDPSVADALVHLRLQAVSLEAAVGLLRTVGCTPLLDFLREDHALRTGDADQAADT